MIATPMLDRINATKQVQLEEPIPPAGPAQLILFHQGFPSRYYRLTKNEIRIGAKAQNDIQIHDPYVSSTHCKIEKRGELYFLIDLASKNGTYLNNILIKETSLNHKCHIQVGRTFFQFELEESKSEKPYQCGEMISRNLLMKQIFQSIGKISDTRETVMIYGETGTGKELIARAIHQKSSRRQKPFLVVNCGAIPTDLLESELFGHVKGSFTGATHDRPGIFQAAHEGTVFLDEIGELPLALQPKLLRTLEYKEVRPVGSEHTRSVDVRIIAATHRDLPQKIKDETFRSDLFYRIHLIPLYLPSLRDRKEDIPLLVKHFAPQLEVTSRALKCLLQYDWPGNIRELKNMVDRMKVLLEHPIMTEKDIQPILKGKPKPFLETIHDMEKNLIREFLERHKWNKSQTARALTMPKSTLMDKIRRYEIQREIK